MYRDSIHVLYSNPHTKNTFYLVAVATKVAKV